MMNLIKGARLTVIVSIMLELFEKGIIMMFEMRLFK